MNSSEKSFVVFIETTGIDSEGFTESIDSLVELEFNSLGQAIETAYSLQSLAKKLACEYSLSPVNGNWQGKEIGLQTLIVWKRGRETCRGFLSCPPKTDNIVVWIDGDIQSIGIELLAAEKRQSLISADLIIPRNNSEV